MGRLFEYAVKRPTNDVTRKMSSVLLVELKKTYHSIVDLHFTRDKLSLNVGDRDGGRSRGDGSEDCATLLDIDKGGAGSAWGDGGEDHTAEVGKGDERAALLVVLNNPLKVLFAESRRRGQ